MSSTRAMQRWAVVVLPALCLGVACATAGTNGDPQPTPDDAGDAGLGAEGARPDADCTSSDACAPVSCESADFCSLPNSFTPRIAVNAISGTAPDDIWFAGSRGSLLHYDGKELRAVDTHTPHALIAVWGAERHVAWVAPLELAPLRVAPNAAGESEVLSMPGDVWPGTPGAVGRVWAIGGSTDNVWLVGDPADFSSDYLSNQNIRQLGESADGGVTWASPLTQCGRFDNCGPRLRALYSFSSTSAWAMGAGGGFRLEPAPLDAGAEGGVVWTPYLVQGQTVFEGVWGARADDAWAVGNRGAMVHFSAAGEPGWEPVASIVTVNLHAIWGSAADDIWAVGDHGKVIHYDGATWNLAESGLPETRRDADLFAVWGSGPDDVWIGGDGVLLHRTTQNRRRQ